METKQHQQPVGAGVGASFPALPGRVAWRLPTRWAGLLGAGLLASVWVAGEGVARTQSAGEGLRPLLKLQAVGVRVYQCAAEARGRVEPAWVRVAPEALLFNERGAHVGTLYAGPGWQPTWQWADGSAVVATALPAQDGYAWLPVTQASPAGRLAGVSAIARLQIDGGAAPQTACDVAHAGQEVRIPFSASYHFYGAGAPPNLYPSRR
ncbi:DUF3455 domain-containing protein [Aquabacterium sp. A7-Y]|uniref:DUF3455 domain-containing protein n=1 Tax=Aquabacterium sp. A7-Y TaxID=1349605 RepID=UPI00223DEACA|nr:DUF3455 domain-containing protein [Aquabacterium sp. A7-Y]MCW7541562.1 DUF3455 domain-containing protein [Aquabacterium sp. A7-Y]